MFTKAGLGLARQQQILPFVLIAILLLFLWKKIAARFDVSDCGEMSEETGEKRADQGVTDTTGHLTPSTGEEEKKGEPTILPKGPQQV